MNPKKAIIILALSAFLLTTHSAHAEVNQVTITWNQVSCNKKCAELLAQRFHKMQQVQDVQTNAGSGTTVLQWKPNSPFSYRSIKNTMQMVGVGVNDIRVTVRGKAKEIGKKVALISLGDKTQFVLVSPTPPLVDEYTVSPNLVFRTLSPELRERILLEAKEDNVLVIEGPLYQPARSPPLQLVVERIQIEKKKN